MGKKEDKAVNCKTLRNSHKTWARQMDFTHNPIRFKSWINENKATLLEKYTERIELVGITNKASKLLGV